MISNSSNIWTLRRRKLAALGCKFNTSKADRVFSNDRLRNAINMLRNAINMLRNAINMLRNAINMLRNAINMLRNAINIRLSTAEEN
jgi:hypothetical protein